MKKVFAVVATVVILAGAYLAFTRSSLMRDVLDDVPNTVEAYDPDKFYYKLLSDNEKKAYDLIMSEILDFPERILIPELSDSELDDVYEAILYDNTQLFFLDKTCSTQSETFKTYFYPEYVMDKEEYALKFSQLENVENSIVSQATGEDDFEKELFLHDYLLKTCSYCDEISSDTSSAYSCLVSKNASCEGYAKAMCRLLEKCGIECFVTVGYVKGENGTDEGHMWNIVRINGKYYHLDPTWDDNNNDNSRLTYTYFNDSDEMIMKTHSFTDRYLGLCTSTDDNFYVRTNALFSSFDLTVKNKIVGLLVKNADSGSPLASFMFENKQDYISAKENLFDNEQIYRLLDRANLVSDKKFVTDRVYYWNDDNFFVINVFNFYR